MIHLKQKHFRKNSRADPSKFYQKHQQRRLHSGRPTLSANSKQANNRGTKPGSRKQSCGKDSRLDPSKERHRVSNLQRELPKRKGPSLADNRTLKITDTSLQSLGSISVIKEAGASVNPKNLKQSVRQGQDGISIPTEDSCISGMSDSSNFLMANPLDEKASAYGFDNIAKANTELRAAEWAIPIP